MTARASRLRRPEGVAFRPLSALRPGEAARILRIDSKEPSRVVKLSSLGVMPGAVAVLVQRSPAVVLRIGETSIAIDIDVADEILVGDAVGSSGPER